MKRIPKYFDRPISRSQLRFSSFKCFEKSEALITAHFCSSDIAYFQRASILCFHRREIWKFTTNSTNLCLLTPPKSNLRQMLTRRKEVKPLCLKPRRNSFSPPGSYQSYEKRGYEPPVIQMQSQTFLCISQNDLCVWESGKLFSSVVFLIADDKGGVYHSSKQITTQLLQLD